MSLHRLLFDPTEANDSANVGAYLRDASGNLLTSTDVGGKQSLDVNVTALTASNIDIRDLAHTQDSVRLGDGTSFFTSTTVGPDTGLDVNLINASIAVTATDLDIRDLSAASDSVEAWAHDGSGNAIGSTGGSLDVNVTNDIDVDDGLMNTAISAAAESVTSTSGKLITSDLADRKNVWIYNNGNKDIFIGPSGVNTSTGFPIPRGSLLEGRFGASVAVHAVSASGTQDTRVLQGS